MNMTEADGYLSSYMKCNKLLRFCHAGFQNWKWVVYVEQISINCLFSGDKIQEEMVFCL